VILSLAHQQSGHTSMEITLEFEDTDIIVEFEPEFDLSINCVDIEKVQWNFQDGNHTRIVANVFLEPEDERGSPAYILPDM